MVQPYWYQQDCLKAIARRRRQKKTTALVVMASGLGKTVTVAFDALEFLKENNGGRVLYLCHQNDILHQARSTFEAIHGNKTTYGLYNGDEKARHTVQFLFASLQTMRGHCRGFRPDEFDYIVVDESHHTYADTYLDVVNYWHPKFLLGITATPDRTDGQDIRRVFGMEIFFLPLDEALAQDLLTPVDYRMLSDEIQLSQVVETPRGRMSIDKLNRLIFIPKRDEEIAKIIAKHAKTFENPRTIIFCASVAHCDHLAKFVENSMPLHSRVPAIERSVRLEMFRQGMIKTVLTVDVFNEGIDIPQANVLVFLRSTASALIFLQQLGRGLRKSDGKDKVIALDFVGNCDRIRMVYNLWESTMKKREAFLQKLKEGGKGGKGTSCPLTPDYGSREPMTLNVNTIDFKEKIVKILEIIGPRNFYPTWQEASRAAIALGISTAEEYRREKKYQADPKLPCNPNLVYSDYPGDTIFFGRVKKSFYRSWQQASKKAKLLGAKNVEEYRNLCPKDPHLPRCPDTFYADFPGWYEFLGTDKYPTWQEASKAAQALGINSFDDYARRYKEDPRLPASPHAEYKDYPGLHTFLGLKKIYETLEEASKAVVALGIKSGAKYRIMRRKDPKLPSNPERIYEDFPGWGIFLQTGRAHRSNTYRSWRKASKAAIALGVTSKDDYALKYKRDNRLPSSPASRYADFPGWPKFLNKD